jgi:ABC-2 type transport system permease protein
MSAKRIWTLIRNDVVHGPKDVILVMSIVMPILLALFVNLAFGNIFTDRAKVGIYDADSSAIVEVLKADQSVSVKTYPSEAELRQAASNGAIDMGIALPAGFDGALSTGTVQLKAYIWGESMAKNRAIIPAALEHAVRQVTGAVVPVNIQTVALGEESSLPWSDRLLPLVVFMAVFFGGLMLPASSLINEKQHRTLEALNVTPATMADVFAGKGITGAFLALAMGVLTLILAGSFSGNISLLVLVLAMGSIMAAEIGLLSGAFIKDMNTLFAIWKSGGILLFGPAVVYMFPQIPSWIGYLFPTYYVIRPIVDISVSGYGMGQVGIYLIVLAAIIFLLGLVVLSVVRRLSTQALRLTA